MKLTSIAAAFALSALATTSHAALVNGDLETGELGPWVLDRTQFATGEFDPWAIREGGANSGQFSMTATNNIEVLQVFDGIDTMDITEVSFAAKHQGLGDALAVTLFYDTESDENIVRTTGDEWNLFNITDLLRANSVLTGISFFGNRTGCPGGDCTRTFIDDVVISVTAPVPLPAGLPLLGGALAMVGFAGWRRKAA
ncbi:VPLPA-CTERM sorting domain-containing protein [Primorskyibacter sp. S187A]|uniref:VPLPA-CTERM sorting domain-containing protein n=1 Tax=Primorskyibacter sp. S187A TaxID=3415130 RepID=UPI003C7A5AC3